LKTVKLVSSPSELAASKAAYKGGKPLLDANERSVRTV